MEDLAEKLRDLIARNDFTTARRLMDKHGLSGRERRELEEAIAAREREALQKRRREQGLRRFHGWLCKHAAPMQKALLAAILLLGTFLAPYSKGAYFAGLDSWDGPPFQEDVRMEWLLAVWLVLVAAFWGLDVLSGCSFVRKRRLSDKQEIELWLAMGSMVLAALRVWHIVG